MVKNVTIIKHQTKTLIYQIYISHEGPFGEVIEALRKEKERWLILHKGMNISETDMFWHLSQYVETQYGPCPTQVVDLEDILYPYKNGNHTLVQRSPEEG